ncbi:MAG: isopentenyl phosphate kinase, partial [Candidatus Bathyarchaeia archaeon]
VAAFPLNPASMLLAEDGRITRMEMEPLRHLLDLGFIPVLHGDLVSDLSRGFSIISGDQIASFLAGRLKPYMVIFGCDVDGVYTGDPKRDENARLIESLRVRDLEIPRGLDAAAAGPRDVTGGFMGKLREAALIAGSGIPVAVLNLEVEGRLLKVINGERVKCTLINP